MGRFAYEGTIHKKNNATECERLLQSKATILTRQLQALTIK